MKLFFSKDIFSTKKVKNRTNNHGKSHLFVDLALCCYVRSYQDPGHDDNIDIDIVATVSFCIAAIWYCWYSHSFSKSNNWSPFTLLACCSSVIVDDSGAMPRLRKISIVQSYLLFYSLFKIFKYLDIGTVINIQTN